MSDAKIDTASDCWLAAMDAMRARRELGLARYGKPVSPGDGEDYLQHLFEELLDALPYMTAFRAERAGLLAEVERLTGERDALARFKAWVHDYLDSKGIPHHPPGTHGAEGCRIGDRMDFVFAELAALRERAKVLKACVSQAYAVACDARAMLAVRTDLGPTHSPMPELAELEKAAAALLAGEGK